MNLATLTDTGNGRWQLAGELDFASVPAVWQPLKQALREQATLILTLKGVKRANSAGLVMLLEALDVARVADCRLQLADVPEELLDLARMSNCEALLTGDNERA